MDKTKAALTAAFDKTAFFLRSLALSDGVSFFPDGRQNFLHFGAVFHFRDI